MMRKQETSVFYIDLDTLLDTRLGTLETHYGHLFPSVLENYNSRWRDEFPGISLEEFKSVYDMRSKIELSKSIKTGMLDVLLEFACETNIVSSSGPHAIKPVVELNIFPYLLLSKEEQQIMAVLQQLLHGTCDIKIINEDIDDITFDVVNERYSMLAMYHGLEWLDSQAGKNPERRKFCPSVGFLVPSLVKDPKHPEFKKNPDEFFKSMCEHLSPMLKIHVAAIHYFNFKIPSS